MNAAWNQIARTIFDRPDVENVSLEELDYLLEEYPYFPVIHFIRARKMIADQMPESSAAASRTSLYYPNPHWLQYQLDGIIPASNLELSLAEMLTTPSQPEELSSVHTIESHAPAAEVELEATETSYDDKRVYEHPVDNTADQNESKLATEIIDLPELTVEEPVDLQEVEFEVGLTEVPETNAIEESIEPETEVFSPAEEGLTVEIAELTDSKNEEPELTIKTSEDAFQIPLEPLYTIDYFASQGIKLRLEEEQQTDPLTVRLKSFTEWLKAMKKIHPEKLDHKMGQEEENHIRVNAESSNEAKELYTEALAEVYVQQGLRQKAVTVFEKLSLLDPSKSAYFAARIREIKEN